MKVKESARLKYNVVQGVWEVHVGITIPYRGQLHGCEVYCQQMKLPIRNQAEVNRVKYNQMPIQEMF